MKRDYWFFLLYGHEFLKLPNTKAQFKGACFFVSVLPIKPYTHT